MLARSATAASTSARHPISLHMAGIPSLDRRTIFVLSGLLAIAVGIWIRSAGLDTELFLRVNAIGSLAPQAWSSVSALGLGVSGFLLLGIWSRHVPSRMAAFLVGVVLGGAIIHIIKVGIPLPRPLSVLPAQDFFQYGEMLRHGAMPSGHAATGVLLFTLVALERSVTEASQQWRRVMFVCVVALIAVLIAISRVAIGAHWVSDILVGAGMGLSVGGLIVRWQLVRRFSNWLTAPLGRRLSAIGLIVGAVSLLATSPFFPSSFIVQFAIAAIGGVAAFRWWQSAR